MSLHDQHNGKVIIDDVSRFLSEFNVDGIIQCMWKRGITIGEIVFFFAPTMLNRVQEPYHRSKRFGRIGDLLKIDPKLAGATTS